MVPVNIDGVRIHNGRVVERGGGVYIFVGDVAIVNSWITSNEATCFTDFQACSSASGGGIFNDGGTLTLVNTVVFANKALSTCTFGCGASGGGIRSDADLGPAPIVLLASFVSENEVEVNCAFEAGSCLASGGGIEFNHALTVDGTKINFNVTDCSAVGPGLACTSQGGGISGGGAQIVNGSELRSNAAVCDAVGYQDSRCVARGGGVFNTFAGLLVQDSTLRENSARCLINQSGHCAGEVDAEGGGIFSRRPLAIVRSTLWGNLAFGT